MKNSDCFSFYQNINFCLKNTRPWLNTSIYDILIKYRRTKLGPLWLLLTTFITILIICFVWSKIFKLDFYDYFSYVFSGFAVWIIVTNFINDSLTLLCEKYNLFIQNIPGSIMVYIFRHVTYGFINFFHLFPVLIFFFVKNINKDFLIFIFLIFLGIILLFTIAILFTTFFSILSSRFRDLIPLIQSIFSASLILTPVIWKKDMLGQYQNYVYFNPLASYLEVLRNPFLGEYPTIISYFVCVSTIIILTFFLIVLFKKKGDRFIFWI